MAAGLRFSAWPPGSVPRRRVRLGQGRQNEPTVDALARRADEGRGIAAIRVGEPRACFDPTISEWGNPLVLRPAPSF